jgi:hypothetical protein
MELEVEHRKVEANRIFLKLTTTMDARELKIARKWAKHLEKENADLDVRLRSQINDLNKSIETIKRLQLNV